METVEVAIVGGGPVGIGLAIDLGQRGINVAVFERQPELHHIPKGQNLTQRTGEHFRAWGVYDAMKKAIRMPAKYGAGGVTTYDNLLSGYHYDWLIRSDVRAFYGADNMRLPQYDTEAVLRERAAQLNNVKIHLGHRVERIEETDDSVELDVTGPHGATALRADYLVGCDGARSIVRESLGLTQSLKSRFRRMVLAVFRSQELDALLERYPGKSYFNALSPEKEGYWQFFGRVGPDTWFFHTTVPDDSKSDTFDLGVHLDKAVGRHVDFETEYLGFWDLRIAIADNYRKGRGFIAGDAAHSHPPYGGYGVNNGFEDARNLAWKLEAALKRWGSEALLDSYSQERQPVFNSTAEDFIERMIESDGDFVANYAPDRDKAAFEAEWAKRAEITKRDVSQYCPHYSSSPMVLGGDGATRAVGEHRHQARPGYLLSPKDDLMERLGPGFNLIAIDTDDNAVAELRRQADNLGIPLDVIEMPATSQTAQWEERLILLRPDRYIAGVGADLAKPGTLGRVVGRA